MRRFFGVAIVAVACAATSAGEANAQDVRGDVAAGYSGLSSSTGGLPLGWFVSAGGNVTENLGVAAEVSGNYRSVTSDPTGVTTSRHEHSILVGPRLVLAGSDKQSVFAHLLVGAANASITSTGTFGRTTVTTTTSDTVICFEPGLGVDLDFNAATSLRVEANYRYLTTSGSVGEFQFVVGVAHRFLR